MELINTLNLVEWVTVLAFITGLWKFVLKSAFDIWWKNKLEEQKQEVGNSLSIQRDIILKQVEFEQVKLERVLPILEEINSAISEHNLMFNTYMHAIANNISYPDGLEEFRLEQDKKMVSALSKISIYIPFEFRVLLYQIRRVISCSYRDAELTCSVLRSCGSSSEIALAAQDLYSELIDCYYSMCSEYISSTSKPKALSEILISHQLDHSAKTNRLDPINQLAWKFLVLPEYHDSNEQVIAQSQYKQLYKAANIQPNNG